MSILHTSSERRRATWVPGADKSRLDSPRPKVLHFIALIRALDTSQTFIIHLTSTQQKKMHIVMQWLCCICTFRLCVLFLGFFVVGRVPLSGHLNGS